MRSDKQPGTCISAQRDSRILRILAPSLTELFSLFDFPDAFFANVVSTVCVSFTPVTPFPVSSPR